jgi:hypothetical protein
MQEYEADVAAYLDGILDEGRRVDVLTVLRLMQDATGETPRLWGGIIGFGRYRYRYGSGREGETFITGIASRRDSMVLYLGPGLDGRADLLAALGRHRAGKGCLYIRRLADVDAEVLQRFIAAAAAERYA